ncbi:MAG TPA: hypothetical protein VKF14_09810 [Candidatus Dormibacteraeota bacterium]|nr:hypothetical protein [Candidatus Dormibacteraeota bacterium]
MGLFDPLDLTVPTIAYSVLHQRKPSVTEEEYVKTLLELTRQARARSDEASRQIREWRTAQVGNAGVAIVDDLLQRLCPVPGLDGALELATVEAALPEARLQKLAGSGRDYLTSLGFRSAEGEAPVHVSVLLFTGSWNYDLVEHVVRDLMGIYEYPHLQHVEEMGPVIFFTQNQVAAVADPMGSERGEWQPSIFFAKGPQRYGDLRRLLRQAMQSAVARAGVRAASLWQRKLGMGNIFEWELRLRCEPDPERLARALDVFAAEAGVAAPRVTERGRLLVFQRIA